MTAQHLVNNRYILHELIGKGGMGLVYQATDRLTRETVALKQVQVLTNELAFMSHDDFLSEHSLRVALAQEFHILSSLRHPHIISVLDYGFTVEQKPFYTMTYLPQAQTVLEMGHNLNITGKVDLIRQTLLALSYLHRHGIIHRDIKPSNVLVNGQTAQLMDFGLSINKEISDNSSAGTLLYMAPELLNRHPASEATDLYAVGVMAYELFAGQHPFDTTSGQFAMQVHNDLPDLGKLRVDHRLANVIGLLLSKRPQDRFPSANACLNALNVAVNDLAAIESTDIRESYLQAAKFVGREAELAQLKSALATSKTGSGSVWLLGGESGVGKSRILNEFRAMALVDGWQVLRGQATADGGAPYQLWRDIIMHLALNATLNKLDAGVLYQVAPNIQQLLDESISTPPKLNGQAAQQRLNNAILTLFQQQEQPTLVLLEDLHWEHSGLSPLRHLLTILSTMSGVMVVGTFRNDERPDLPNNLPGAQTILLDRLSNDQIAELCHAILGEKVSSPELIALLTQETEGNTFFIVEVIRALAEEAGQLDQIEDMRLPKSVLTLGMQALLERRFNKMLDQDQELLQLAAVAGRQLDIPLLEYLSTSVTFADWLQRAADAAILLVFDGHWMFAHDKLRETILTKLNHVQHKVLHHQIAEAIRTTYPNNSDYNQTLLEHWYQADMLDEEIQCLHSVAHHLIRTTAEYTRALNLLERSLTRLPPNDSRRVALLNFQANACLILGDYDQTRVAAQDALKLAQHHQDDAGASTSLYDLAEVGYFLGNDYSSAYQYYEQSLQLRQVLQDKAGIASCLVGLGKVSNQQRKFTQALDYYHQSLAINQTIGDQWGIAQSLNYLGIVLDDLGRYEEAQEYHQASLEIRQTIGDKRGIAISLLNLGWIANRLKNYKEARNYIHQSLDIKRTIQETRLVYDDLMVLCFVCLQDNDTEITPHIWEALEIAQSFQSTPMVLALAACVAWAYLDQGDTSVAAKIVGLVQDHPAHNSQVQTWLNVIIPRLEELVEPTELNALYADGKSLDAEALINHYLVEKRFLN